MAGSIVDSLSAPIRQRYREVSEAARQQSLAIAGNPRFYRGGRLEDIERGLIQELESLTGETRHWYESVFPEIFRRGAQEGRAKSGGGGGRYRLTVDDQNVISQMADEGANDHAIANEFAKRDVHRMMDDLKVGRDDPKSLTRLVHREGVRGMRYSDGRRFQIATYNDMALTARSEVAFNVGTITAAQRQGFTAFRISDGPDCGLSAHNDPQRADGLVVHSEDALEWPLSHPYCQRRFTPEKDGPKVPISIGKRKFKVSSLPGMIPPGALAAGAGIAVGGSLAVALADANLRKRLTSIAFKSRPWWQQFQLRIGKMLEMMERQGLAEIIDIRTGQAIKSTAAGLRENIASYADTVMEGAEELPEHVAHVIGVSANASKKVVGDAFESFMEFVNFEREQAGEFLGKVLPFDRREVIFDSFSRASRGWQLNKWTKFTFPKVGKPFVNFNQYPAMAQRFFLDRLGLVDRLGGAAPFRLRIPGGFMYDRAARVIVTPHKWVRLTGTARVRWDSLLQGATTPKELFKFLPHIRLNPNGLVRAGFGFANGKVLPSLSMVGRGPLRMMTRMNPGGSLSTTVRLVTKGWANFSVSINTELEVIRTAIKEHGLFDLKEFTSLEKVSNQFDLLRASVRDQVKVTGRKISQANWEDFSIRSLAAELRVYGFSVFDIARTFRIKWEDALTLVQRAKVFFRETMDNAGAWYRRTFRGADVLDLTGAKTRFDLFEDGSAQPPNALTGKLTPEPAAIEGSPKAVGQAHAHEAANRVSSMFNDLFPKAFPEKVQWVVVDELPGEAVARYEVVNDFPTIQVRRSTWDRWDDEVAELWDSSAQAGHFNKRITDRSSLFTHEMAHHLETQLTDLQKQELLNRLRRLPLWKREKIAGASAEEILAKEVWGNQALIGKNVSIYAMKNQYEFMAESLTEYLMSPRPSEVSRVVGGFFTDIFGPEGVGLGGDATTTISRTGPERLVQAAENIPSIQDLRETWWSREPQWRIKSNIFDLFNVSYPAMGNSNHPSMSTWDAVREYVGGNSPDEIFNLNIFRESASPWASQIQERVEQIGASFGVKTERILNIDPRWITAPDGLILLPDVGFVFSGNASVSAKSIKSWEEYYTEQILKNGEIPEHALPQLMKVGDWLLPRSTNNVTRSQMVALSKIGLYDQSLGAKTGIEGIYIRSRVLEVQDKLLEDLTDLATGFSEKFDINDPTGELFGESTLDKDQLDHGYAKFLNEATDFINNMQVTNEPEVQLFADAIGSYQNLNDQLAAAANPPAISQAAQEFEDLHELMVKSYLPWSRELDAVDIANIKAYNSEFYLFSNNIMRRAAGQVGLSDDQLLQAAYRINTAPAWVQRQMVENYLDELSAAGKHLSPEAIEDLRRNKGTAMLNAAEHHRNGTLNFFDLVQGPIENYDREIRTALAKAAKFHPGAPDENLVTLTEPGAPLRVWRGTTFHALPDQGALPANLSWKAPDGAWDAEVWESLVGERLFDHATVVSTTINERFAFDWASSRPGEDRVVFEVLVPPGIAAGYITDVITGAHEWEYLVRGGYALRVTSVDVRGAIPKIYGTLELPE